MKFKKLILSFKNTCILKILQWKKVGANKQAVTSITICFKCSVKKSTYNTFGKEFLLLIFKMMSFQISFVCLHTCKECFKFSYL